VNVEIHKLSINSLSIQLNYTHVSMGSERSSSLRGPISNVPSNGFAGGSGSGSISGKGSGKGSCSATDQ
jgi:hypothetical protein